MQSRQSSKVVSDGFFTDGLKQTGQCDILENIYFMYENEEYLWSIELL